MRQLSELGIEPNRRLGLLRPPTQAEIIDFEKHFGVRLPKDYIAFLSAYNGGRPRLRCFKTITGYRWGVGSFHYLLPEDRQRQDFAHHPNGWEFGNLWAETREIRATIRRLSQENDAIRDGSTDEIVPFALDPGNANVFAFDVRDYPASVCVIIVDEGFRVSSLAGSFTDFVGQLYEDEQLQSKGQGPSVIRLLRKSDDSEFPYGAALSMIKALSDVDIRLMQPIARAHERHVRLPAALVGDMEEMAARQKNLNFSWKGPPALNGALLENFVKFNIVDDQTKTLELAKKWADKLGLRVLVR